MLGESDDHCCIQRYGILSKSWEILEDDTWFNLLLDPIVVPMGQILIKGSQIRDGDDDLSVVVTLYKPATNKLLDVSVDGILGKNLVLVAHDNKVFELIYDQEKDQVKRLLCYFESDRPTMVLAETTEDETCAVIDTYLDFCTEVLTSGNLGWFRCLMSVYPM